MYNVYVDTKVNAVQYNSYHYTKGVSLTKTFPNKEEMVEWLMRNVFQHELIYVDGVLVGMAETYPLPITEEEMHIPF